MEQIKIDQKMEKPVLNFSTWKNFRQKFLDGGETDQKLTDMALQYMCREYEKGYSKIIEENSKDFFNHLNLEYVIIEIERSDVVSLLSQIWLREKLKKVLST